VVLNWIPVFTGMAEESVGRGARGEEPAGRHVSEHRHLYTFKRKTHSRGPSCTINKYRAGLITETLT
jgi:hypothetical protein